MIQGKDSTPQPSAQTVLLVDDVPDILQSLRTLLLTSNPQLRVLTASSGEEALRLLDFTRIDLVACDYRMPGMDGVTVLRETRRKRPGAARILITAFPDLKVAIDAINEANVRRFLVKPFEPQRFVEAVHEGLESRLRGNGFGRIPPRPSL